MNIFKISLFALAVISGFPYPRTVAGQGERRWLPEIWDRAVVLLEIETIIKGQRGFIPDGTGFLVPNPSSGYRPLLVTCRHLLRNRDRIWVRFNRSDGKGVIHEPVQLLTKDGRPIWTGHADTSVDLAAIPILFQTKFEQPIPFDSGLIAVSDSVWEGDEIVFIGFPLANVLSGSYRNQPAVRAGIVSQKIREDLRLGDGSLLHRGLILLQSNSIGGNSGSPVFSKMDYKLVGVVKGGVVLKNSGNINYLDITEVEPGERILELMAMFGKPGVN